jgi:hypothetical protein
MMAAGVFIQLLGVFAVISLLRTHHYSPIMHVVPYVICSVGGALLLLEKGTSSLSFTGIMFAFCMAMHLVVVLEIRHSRSK